MSDVDYRFDGRFTAVNFHQIVDADDDLECLISRCEKYCEADRDVVIWEGGLTIHAAVYWAIGEARTERRPVAELAYTGPEE